MQKKKKNTSFLFAHTVRFKTTLITYFETAFPQHDKRNIHRKTFIMLALTKFKARNKSARSVKCYTLNCKQSLNE